jgi:HopA1 effector protein family
VRQVNCHIPIKVCVRGRLSDAQLDELGESLARALAARIAFAERIIASHSDGYVQSRETDFSREKYDPSREDVMSTYRVPSYRNRGERTSIKLQTQQRRGGRPWFIRRAINIRANVGGFLDVLESWKTLSSRDLLSGEEHETRWVSVWLAQVNREFRFLQFFDILQRRAEELSRVRPNQDLYSVGAVHEDLRQQLIEIDESGLVEREIPRIEQKGKVRGEGLDALLLPGARVLFASMVLPKIELGERAELGTEIHIPVRLRDLKFLVAGLFEYRFKLSWEAYVREFGDSPATVRVLPVSVRRRIHYGALQYLVERAAEQRIGAMPEFSGPEHRLYGLFYVLNNGTLGELPPAVREAANSISNDETLKLDNAQIRGNLEPNWKAAYVYSVVKISPNSVDIARYRPQAAALADALIPLIRERLVTVQERGDFERFFKANYSRHFPVVFEILLDELKHREGGRWFDRLFEATQEAKDYDLQMLVIELVKQTKYANDPRVADLIEYRQEVHRSVLSNEYDVENNKLILKKLFGDKTVSPGDILYELHKPYYFDEEAYRPKNEFVKEWGAAALEEREKLIGRIERGEDPKGNAEGYTDIEFADAVLKATLRRFQITEDNFGKFFDTITIRYSVRFLGLKKKPDALGIETVVVTYRVVAREEGGEWNDVGDVLEASDTEFDYMIEQWVQGHVSAIIIAIAKTATVIAAIGVAWEFRIIQTLVNIAGGAEVVIPQIILSTIFEVIVNGFTFDSFLLGAIDGFLGALFFRGAGLLARGFFGRSITTASFREGLKRWIGVQIFKGAIGGGGTGAAIRFSHDVYLVATGRGTWSSPADYAKSIGYGAAIGIGVELAGPILLAPVAETALALPVRVARLLYRNRISLERWGAWSVEAYSNLSQRLRDLLERQPGRATTLSDGFRILYEQVTKAYESLGRGISVRAQAAVVRQSFELAKAPLSQIANQGLKKLITAAEGDPSRALNVFNALADNPQQAAAFLELLAPLEQSSVRRVLNNLSGASGSEVQRVVRTWLESGPARESLEDFLDLVWRDRQRLLEIGDGGGVYDLYAQAREANPLTRTAEAYLEEIEQITLERPQGARYDIQGRDLSTGFHRFTRAGADLSRIKERIYLNVNADRAPEVMRFVVRDIVDNPTLPGIGRAKLAGPGEVSARADTIVIYAENQSAMQNALNRIRSYHAANPTYFKTTTPPLTNRVMEGVSVAAEPLGQRGRSFGTVRSDAIYDALEQAVSSSETFQQFRQRVFKLFQRRNINPVAPQLNLPTESNP